jgi:hypothetical protein
MEINMKYKKPKILAQKQKQDVFALAEKPYDPCRPMTVFNACFGVSGC